MRTYSYTELLDFFFSVKQTLKENEPKPTDNLYREIKEALEKLKETK